MGFPTMHRAVFATFALGVLILLEAPSGLAAAVLDTTDDTDIKDLNGTLVTGVKPGETVQLIAVITNEGDAVFNGTVFVLFKVTRENSTYEFNETVASQIVLDVDETEEFSVLWTAPKQEGDYTFEASIRDVANTLFPVTFEVSENVSRGTLVDYAIRYAWFYAAFIGLVILFAAVMRFRKTPRGP